MKLTGLLTGVFGTQASTQTKNTPIEEATESRHVSVENHNSSPQYESYGEQQAKLKKIKKEENETIEAANQGPLKGGIDFEV